MAGSNIMDQKINTFYCDCVSSSHQIRTLYFPSEESDYDIPELYLTIHLCRFGFFNRLWKGIKYIFGYKSRFGDFDEFVFNRTTAIEMRKALLQYIRDCDKVIKSGKVAKNALH